MNESVIIEKENDLCGCGIGRGRGERVDGRWSEG